MDRFELVEKLGEGGMGAVYRANDKELGRVVAVKVIAMQVDAESIRRFQREMRLLSKLSHQNIIRVYDAGQTADNRAYFSMELIEGCDLDRKRRENGPMPLDQVIPILSQAADALACIHLQGLLHRDIKPGNMMLEEGGRVVVMDFGLVKDPTATMLTQEGRAVGTPRYMPPEVLAAREATGAVDVWALGITAYELLTGKQVYPVNSLPEMMDMIVNHPPPDLDAACPGLPKWFLDLYLSTLAKDPKLRPTAQQVKDGLRRRGAPAGNTQAISRPRKALTSSFNAIPATPTPQPSFADTVGKRAGRVAIAAVVLGTLGLGFSAFSGRTPEVSATPSAAATPAAPVTLVEVKFVPPRRAIVQVPASMAAGSTISMNGVSRKVDGTEAAFDDLPPGQDLSVTVAAADGRELAARTVKTPEPARTGKLTCHPTDDSAIIDFDLEVPRKLTVSIHRAGQDAPAAEVTREAGPRWFHHVFTGLRPHTPYVLRASDTSGWSVVVNYPFETLRIEHRKALDAILPNFAKGWNTSLYDVDALRAEPDPRTKPVLKEVLTRSDPLEIMDSRKLLWVIEELHDEELSGMLFDLYLKHSHKEASHDLFRGAYSGRHPALLRAAPGLIERRNQGVRRWLLYPAADGGGADTADKIAKAMETDASWCDDRSPYLFVRTDAARARTHLERWAALTDLEGFHRWLTCAALSVLADGPAARALGKILRGKHRYLAARFLAALPDPVARDELLAAHRAEPDDTTLTWALAASGDPRAAELFVTRLGAGTPRARQDAALCLGVLRAGSPLVFKALRDALTQNPAEVAGAAAYALGELQDADAAPGLLTLATSDRDADGLAALALGRLRHRPAAAPLITQLTTLCAKAVTAAPDARGWIRLAALATALGELGDTGAADALHVLEKLVRVPRGVRDCAQAALKRLARGAEAAAEARFLIIPQVPAVRAPFPLYSGESIALSGVGVVSVTTGAPASIELQTPAPTGARLGLSMLIGAVTYRLGRATQRVIAEQPAHPMISCYDQFAASPLVPRDAVTGFALVTLRR